MADLVLRNVRVPDGELVDVVVDGGRIAAVGPAQARSGTTEIDGGGRAVLPGLVEPHLHLDKALLGDGGARTLDDAVAVTAEAKKGFTADDVRERAGTVLRWALRHGTTAVRTPVDVDPTVGLTSVHALLELRERWADTVALQVVAFPQEGIEARPGTHELLVEALESGADVAGACSYAEADVEGCRAHLRQAFALAERFGVPLDVHADFAADASDPRHVLAEEIAAMTTAHGMAGRVVLGHVTTLRGLGEHRREKTLDALAGAGVGVVVLPPTDLYLQGGTAGVRELCAAGVVTAISSNNVRNAFTPTGRADPLDVALLARRMGEDAALDMVTGTAAALIGRTSTLAEGARADLVVLDSTADGEQDHETALLDQVPRRWVISGGRVVAATETHTTLHAP